MAPPDPDWEPSLIETTASETNYKVSAVQQPSIAAVDGTFGTPLVSFNGIPFTGARPPDTNADVGPNHVIQMVNSQFQIFDKSGNSLVGPSNINSLWIAATTNDNCMNNNDGDPIVQYDHLADRWLMSQFVAFTDQCIAISQTADPVAGGWILYDFPVPVTNDYFKFGVWPDAYYMGTNSGYPNGHAWAFDRTNMLLANAATFQAFTLQTDGAIMLPSNLEGPAPPAGAPNVFMRFVDGAEFGGVDRLELTEFHVDFATPALSTFTQLPDIPTVAFDGNLCSLGIGVTPFTPACIDQPGTTNKVDTVRGFTKYQLQYRNFGTDETLVVTHEVDADGNDLAGIRWYEVRKVANVWSIFQQGTHSPDSTHRWMGSIAMDECRNIAMGYSVSSTTVFPGISYVGRLANDPLNTMPQGEFSLIAGAGSQTVSSRWGDYSSMMVDPVDNRSFWYTTEYMPAGGQWQTLIAQLMFDECLGTGDINGFKFEDKNADGTFNGADAALANWQICIFLPGNEPDPMGAEVCGLTDVNGQVSFDDLPNGDYVACETVQNLWTNFSDVCQNVTIDINNTEVPVNFANWKDVTIMGEKWEDTDADGIDNANAEPRLADWEIKLIHGGGVLDLTTTTADGSGAVPLGKYTFGPLGPEWAGSAMICETVQPGWIPIHPGTNCIDITIESGGDLGPALPDDDTDFGNLLAFEAEKTWTHTDYNWDPICVLFDVNPPFDCLADRPRETDIPSDEVLAEPLPEVLDKFIAEAHTNKNKVKNVTPGAFYALTTIEIKADLDSLTVDEIYGDCYDTKELIKFVSKKPTRNVKVAVADSDKKVTELSDDIYDEVGGKIIGTPDKIHAKIEITDKSNLEAGDTLYVLVKFQQDLKNEAAPGNAFDKMCDNTEEVTADLFGQVASVTAEASLRITTG